jgi:hypothetical protein
MAYEQKSASGDVIAFARTLGRPRVKTQSQLRSWLVTNLLPRMVQHIVRKHDVIIFDVDLTVSTIHSRGYPIFQAKVPLYVRECIPMDFFLFVLRMNLDGVRIGFATNSDSLDSVPIEGKLCGAQLIRKFMNHGLHLLLLELFGRGIPVKVRRNFVNALVKQLPMVGARQSVRNHAHNDLIDPHAVKPMRIEDKKLLDIVYSQSRTGAKYDLHQLPSGKCWHMAALETLRPGFLPQGQEIGIFIDDDRNNEKNINLFHNLKFVHMTNGFAVAPKKGLLACFDGNATYKVQSAFTIQFWNAI